MIEAQLVHAMTHRADGINSTPAIQVQLGQCSGDGQWDLGQRIGLMCLVDSITLKDKADDNSHKTHDKVTTPLTDAHNYTANNTKKNANLGNLVATISWNFIVMI